MEVLQRRGFNKDISVDAASLVDMHAWLNGLVSIDVIAHCLDININDTQDLIYRGCLNPLSCPSLDRQPTWKFQYHAGHDLLKKIRERISIRVSITSDLLISGGVAIREMKTYGLSVGQFVRAIIDGWIIPRKEIPYQGLSSFFFSQGEITRYIRSWQPTQNESFIDYKRATAFLGARKEMNDRIFTRKRKNNREFKYYGEEKYDLSLLVRLVKLTYASKRMSVNSLNFCD